MISKRLIVMITLVLVVFCSQLTAEKVVGESIFPNIETPHPYPKAPKGTVVWSETISQDGASWLKVHFSRFRLNDNDYVDVIDRNEVTVEHISGSDISDEYHSKFKIKRNSDNSINFWLPAIAGDMLRIELYRGEDNRGAWGFVIDEVGVGFEPLPYEYPVMHEELAMINCICQSNDLWNIACFSYTTYYYRGEAVGRMLYRKSGNWLFGTGFLLSCNNSKHFITTYDHIDSQTVLDTLEVYFRYQYSSCSGSDIIYGSTVFGDTWEDWDDYYNFSLLKLTARPYYANPLLPLNREPVKDEYIYIVQHPYGGVKKIGFGTVSSTTSSGGLDFSYYIDTVYESHGAPVIATDDHKVLGIDSHGNCPNKAVKLVNIYSRIKNYINCD